MSESILLILPTFNEIENLPLLIDAVFSLKIPGLEILVVDDQSPDGTGHAADQLASQAASHPEQGNTIHVIHRNPPRGRGLAGIDGFIFARDHGYAYAIEMDADFSHPPRYIPALLAAFNQSAQAGREIDLCIGSRYIPGGKIEGWPRWRHWNSAVANHLAKAILGLKASDCTSGCRCFTRRALQTIPWETLKATGPMIVEEILFHYERSGLRHVEIPIIFVERQQGVSKVNLFTILRWLRELFKIRMGF